MNDCDAADALAHVEAQIHVYEALASAVERRREVYELLEEAEDPAAARLALQTLLGTDEVGAQAIMDLQLRRLTVTGRAMVTDRLHELRHYASTLS